MRYAAHFSFQRPERVGWPAARNAAVRRCRRIRPRLIRLKITQGPARRRGLATISKWARQPVTGLWDSFDGRIPPFVQADGPPAHLRVTLDYVVKPEKLTTDGAEVSFHVEKAEILVLQNAVGPDNVMPPADQQIEFPVPLDQIQSALNVKATLKSDGTVAQVVGGDANSQKINLGIELRKLFLLLLPVAFPNNAVKVGEQWNFSDGLLGKNAGKTTYTASLTSFHPKKGDTVFQCSETANAVFDERLDKAGHPGAAEADAVDTSKGSASFTGDFSFTAPTKPDKSANRSAGRLQEGRFNLTAVLDRKRTLPDPGNPDAPLDTHVDLTAAAHGAGHTEEVGVRCWVLGQCARLLTSYRN